MLREGSEVMPWEKIPAPVAKCGLIALCVAAALCYLRFVPPESPWSARQIAGHILPEPKEIVRVERQIVQGPERIKIIPKETIVEKIKYLPTPVTVADPASQVVAAADIPPSPEGGTAIAIVRTIDNTGVGSIEYAPKPPKFLQVKKEFGIRAGMGTGGLVVGEVYAHPLRLGPVNLEARGFVNRDNSRGADFGAAVLVDYRF